MSRCRGSRHAAALLVLLAAGCAEPGSGDGTSNGSAPPASGELLIADRPAGWIETGAMASPNLRMAEFGPADEADGELERVTFEAQGGAPLPDPIDFVQGVSQDLKSRCKDFRDFNVASELENGYPTSVHLMVCAEFKDSPHGQVVMTKAIQGNEQFYVITRRRLVAPVTPGEPAIPQADMALWSTYLKGIHVCETGSADHPCPEAATAALSRSD